MKRALGITLLIIGVWAMIVYMGDRGGRIDSSADTASRKDGSDAAAARAMLENWPSDTRQIAERIIDKYGAPDEVSGRRFVWNENKPWKRTIVHRDSEARALEQTVSYRIPSEKFQLLSKLPGTVRAERGKEELVLRARREEHNFLAANLADEVMRGRRSAEDARSHYKRAATLALAGKSSPYTETLLFMQEPAAPQKNGAKSSGVKVKTSK